MRRLIQLLMLALLLATGLLAQGVSITRAYNYPTQDTVLTGLKSIRGAAYYNDVDGNGMAEIAVTNYAGGGTVHVFEVVGTDSVKLVWSGPTPGGVTTGDSPRFVAFGDLDNDDKQEVIYHASGTGVLIFEWDGVIGSGNYGTLPSFRIEAPTLTINTTRYLEQFFVDDVDADGDNELILAYDSHYGSATLTTDAYYIFSAQGDWSTDDPGFSAVAQEFYQTRATLSNHGGSGTPFTMIPANLDGTGPKELILHNWNSKNVTPIRSTGKDTYVLADTNGGGQNLYLTASDNVSLFGGMAVDIDGDGREEVYLPDLYSGIVDMISYDVGQTTSKIDSSNIFRLSVAEYVGGVLGFGYGDIDGDNKKNLYFTTSYPYNVMSLEFQGGDKKDTMNWERSVLYAGESDIYSAMFIKDSLGNIDTTGTVNTAFASKPPMPSSDIDGDGYEDLILPYQALNDSITVTTYTWNGTNSSFDSTIVKILNPKRWGFRVLEWDPTLTSVSSKDWTVIMPEDYRLEQNFPNPFNPSTTIQYLLPVQERISLKIYDISGRLVKSLLNDVQAPAGPGEVVWNGRNEAGQTVASGTYIYTLTWGNFAKSQKMMLLK